MAFTNRHGQSIWSDMEKVYRPSECYTYVQVARLLWPDRSPGCALRVALHRYRNENGLPYTALSTRRIVYPKAEVAEWLKARQRNISDG